MARKFEVLPPFKKVKDFCEYRNLPNSKKTPLCMLTREKKDLTNIK